MSQHEGWARSRIYDCADVNDIIQILKTGYTLPNPADLLSLSLSPPLYRAAGLENPMWISVRAGKLTSLFWLPLCNPQPSLSPPPAVCVTIHCPFIP